MKSSCCPHNADVGLLVLRLALAAVFIAAGWMKVSNMDMTVGFFASIGLSSAVAWIVTILELAAGIAMLLGTYVCLAGLIISVIMVGAIATVTGPMGVAGYQINFVLIAMAVGVGMAGPGKYAVCAGKRSGEEKKGCCQA